jgi:hypothetical protein
MLHGSYLDHLVTMHRSPAWREKKRDSCRNDGEGEPTSGKFPGNPHSHFWLLLGKQNENDKMSDL